MSIMSSMTKRALVAARKDDLVRSGSHVLGSRGAIALSFAFLILGAACGSSKPSATSTATEPGSTTASAPAVTAPAVTASATVSAPAGAGGQVPSSCGQIPTSVIGSYIGGVATTRTLGTTSHSVSCEFVNAASSKILILTIGSGGTQTTFEESRGVVGKGDGVTTASVGGLGADAFSVSKNGVIDGFEVLTDQGQVFVVTANLLFAQDEALIEQLMDLF